MDCHFTIHPMTEDLARAVLAWHYDPPYDFYDALQDDAEDLDEYLSGPFRAVLDGQGDLIGFICWGLAARVPGGEEVPLYGDERVVDLGLGLRPDLTGGGLGLSFVRTSVQFVREHLRPAGVRLVVTTWNQRAITVYKRAGFEPVATFRSQLPGSPEFLLMYLRP